MAGTDFPARRVLVALDIGGLYRLLGQGGGLSQWEIARRTGQSQSEVSEIVSGRRQVENLHLLRRVLGADLIGLGLGDECRRGRRRLGTAGRHRGLRVPG